MRLVIIGGPGAGKGTQAAMLSREFGIKSITTGDMFRSIQKRGCEEGMEIGRILSEGKLVPDDITIKAVGNELGLAKYGPGFILDGFPRTVPQADGLDAILASIGRGLDLVIDIEVDDEDMVRRLTGRMVCPECGLIFNRHNEGYPGDGACGACGVGLEARDDDNEETIRRRLKTYHTSTVPLKEYYSDRGLLHTYVSEGIIERTYANIIGALKARGII
ncbi:MAG: adenylate kinase [Oscillospiraceae bacterium]|nr:adenylate kinase [Oscillospiraceae bacterium]